MLIRTACCVAVLVIAAHGSQAQNFYENTGPTPFNASFTSQDEIADDTPFTGTEHVASFSFQYTNQNAGPVNATVRFYTVDQNTGDPGALIASVPVSNLPAGVNQTAIVNLTPEQQFDWSATPGIYHLSNVSGGFVSLQFAAPECAWHEASGPSLDGFFDITTGQFMTFNGDTPASFYLTVASSETFPAISLKLTPTSVQGGQPSRGTITLSTPAATPTLVSLSTNAASIAMVPPSITIPPGTAAASFAVRTKPVTTTTQVLIAASSHGTTKTARLTVRPAP